jgi:iron complex transport system substrate-binding protein
MSRRIAWGIALCLGAAIAAPLPAAARVVTDATGRRIDVPDAAARILPAGQPAAILIYALAPEKMLGWPRKPGAPGLAFLTPAARELPEIGVLVRDGTVNSASIAELKPDLIVDYGSLAPGFVAAATRLQAETGIPYLIFDGALEASPQVLRLIGAAFGADERAEMLAAVADDILARTRARAPLRQQAGSIRAYYSRSADGLATATSRAHATDVLRLLGLVNVADGNAAELPQVAQSDVLAWQPDVVFAPNAEFIKAFAAADWAGLPAVKQQRVFAAPRPPFGWIDEPPSLNRLLGLLWVGRLLYPQIYPEDLRQETRDFYRRFYQVEPSEAQLDQLLASGRLPPR